MIVTVMKARFEVPHFRSLKERRGMLQSIRSRVVREFGVSAAETPAGNDPRRFELGLALVSSDPVLAEKDAERIRSFLDSVSEEHMSGFEISSERW
jgi:uncharacterized protein YlxP (DUF503 family)